ncbi:dormancy-associated protein homolog 3 isoform X1 [Mercurialis annua]|uniref:dormancy-associated protein homolog 3 isoform X1 n=1 Tax=Mercurialis annua TaxID=3986 RepID=UPI00215F9F76|nr:dormancy-associated protein homolog 3 isoform X1 [Mercurialis annua]
MSLLDQLWDDTVAGPRPDSGLGKLRKQSTFNMRSTSGKESDGRNVRSLGDDSAEEVTKVTRSIMIVKPPGYQNGSTPPVSPAGSTTPVSPFSGKEAESHFGFEEDQHRTHMRRQARLDPGVLLLLTTSDI